MQQEQQPVEEGQNVIQQEQPQIVGKVVGEAPANTDAGPLEPQPP